MVTKNCKYRIGLLYRIIVVSLIVSVLSCEIEEVTPVDGIANVLTFRTQDTSLFETESEGTFVNIVFVGDNPEPGVLNIRISSDELQYGTDFTTIPDGSSGVISLNVEGGAVGAAFQVFPVDNNTLSIARIVNFEIESYEGSSRISNGVNTHFFAIADDERTNETLLGGTSFEEPLAGTRDQYFNLDTFVDAGNDHDIENVANRPDLNWVDYVAETNGDQEIGFNAVYLTNGGFGFLEEPIGVTNNVGRHDDIPFPDGVQGYTFEDIDGAIEITFDPIEVPDEFDFSQVAIDVFAQLGTSFDPDDFLIVNADITYRDGSVEEGVNIFRNPGAIGDCCPELQGKWTSVGLDKKFLNVDSYAVTVIAINTANSEKFSIDNLRVYGFREN